MLAENCLSVYKGYLGTSGRFYKIPCVMMIKLRLKGKKPKLLKVLWVPSRQSRPSN